MRGSRTRPLRLVAGLAALVIGAGFLVGCGGDASGPDVGLVDGGTFSSCLKASAGPVADWRGHVVANDPGPDGAVPSSAVVRMRPHGTITVYPSEAAAEELASRVTFEGEDYAGGRPQAERWGNVLMTGYEDSGITDAEERVVRGCVEDAATLPARPDPGSFTSCGGRAGVERLSVRGISCGRAAGMLAAKGRLTRCSEHGGDFTCLSEYLCCMLSAQYMGNGKAELVFDF